MKNIITFIITILATSIFAQDLAHRQLVQNERNFAKLKMRKATNIGNNYDVVYHRLELTPDMNQDNITGIVTTYFKPTTDTNNIEFDLMDQLTVSSVTGNGASLNFTHQNNVLHVNFPSNLPAGVLDSLTVNYSGTPPDSGFDSYVTTEHNTTPIVWTLSEPYGARDWWPCKQDLTDKIDSIDVILHYPALINGQTMSGVSNGLLTSETVSGTTKTSVWKHRYPIATYLVAFAITNYEKHTINAGVNQSFPIDNFFYPENATNNQSASQSIIPVMNYFENSFGDYPFNNEKYGQAQFGWGGGMEHQTITFLVSYSRGLMAHELAHQWFGDAITCGSWYDIWLNEGFATYSEGLTREHLDGIIAFNDWKQNTTNTIISQPNGSVYVDDISNVNRIFSWRLSYSKGAMVLNMLRLKVGDNNFFQGLKNYVNQKSFQYAQTADFKNVMATTSGQNLDEFFNDWIFGEGYPTYDINVVRSGTYRYRITVNQTTSDSSVSFFEMPLPFTFTGNGQTFEVLLDNTSNGQVFEVNVGFDATNVDFDPNSDIVKGNTTMNANLGVNDFENQSFSVYPNPASDFININNKQNLVIDEISIYDVQGRFVKKYDVSKQVLKTEELSDGNYFVYIKSGNKTYVYKTIIKH